MTQNSMVLPIALIVVFAIAVAAFFIFANPYDDSDDKIGSRIAVALVGTGEASCFTIDLINLDSNEIIGDATDCLSNITPDGDGLRVIGTTTFNFPQGQLVTRGETTAQPLLHGANGFTHAT